MTARRLLPDTEGLLAAARDAGARGLPGARLHQRRPDHGAPARGRRLRRGDAARLADRQRPRPDESRTASGPSSAASRCRSIVDAGVGTASDACVTMEQGVDGILMNTALAEAQDPVAMARAMGLAVESGRTGLPRRPHAAPRSGGAVVARSRDAGLARCRSPRRHEARAGSRCRPRASNPGVRHGRSCDRCARAARSTRRSNGRSSCWGSRIGAWRTSWPPGCCEARARSTPGWRRWCRAAGKRWPPSSRRCSGSAPSSSPRSTGCRPMRRSTPAWSWPRSPAARARAASSTRCSAGWAGRRRSRKRPERNRPPSGWPGRARIRPGWSSGGSSGSARGRPRPCSAGTTPGHA